MECRDSVGIERHSYSQFVIRTRLLSLGAVRTYEAASNHYMFCTLLELTTLINICTKIITTGRYSANS
jgi:hypothetical protein